MGAVARASVLPVGLMVGGFRSTDSTAQRPKQVIWGPPFHRTFPRRCHSTPILRGGVNPNSYFASMLHGQRKSHIHFAIHCSAGPGNTTSIFRRARKTTSIFGPPAKHPFYIHFTRQNGCKMDVGSIFGPPANIHFTSILPRKMDVKWMLAGGPQMDAGFWARPAGKWIVKWMWFLGLPENGVKWMWDSRLPATLTF